MVDNLLNLFREYQSFAIVISIFISIVIAVLGVVPSVFITAANILFFGFWNGMFISFAGEAMGAGIAFLLYRKGLKKTFENRLDNYLKVKKLVNAEGREAFYLVLALRLIPFVPSGLVTLAASIGRISFLTFIIASSLGKLPALFIEAYAVNEITDFDWQGKLILAIAAIVLLYWVIVKRNKLES
ncbi:MAG: TVP38/TMEM64 family protein [Ferruginibacter sp.]|nr:TVP38/TMEM64 family protein [Ferruginibacter sp.]